MDTTVKLAISHDEAPQDAEKELVVAEVLKDVVARQHLNPQPSDDPADPLNWPLGLKISALVQVCILASLGTLNAAIINPAYGPIAEEFGISEVQASYQTTINIAMSGVAALIWVPLANVYGRRPVYLGSTLLYFVTALACAFTRSYAQLLAVRVLNGLCPAAMTLGAATVVDLFFFHQRGRAMGFYTMLMTTGGHLAPIIGGLIGQFLGWRWNFKFAACVNAGMFVVIFFCLPETLYVRHYRLPATACAYSGTSTRLGARAYVSRLKLWSSFPGLRLRASQFIAPPFKMARYPSVLFPALYYSAQYGFASIIPAVTAAEIFAERLGFNTLQIGLAYGGALTIGSCLGELAAGMVVDAIVKRERRRLGGEDPQPESRLKAIWTGEILVPAGLLVYGFAIQYGAHWAAPVMGMGIACFGMQIVTTACYTYSIDCYRTQGSEVSQVYNIIRQETGMTYAFYVIPMARKIGYQFTFLVFALVGSTLGFIPILVLMWRGERIRKRMGVPKNVNAFDTDEMLDENRATY